MDFGMSGKAQMYHLNPYFSLHTEVYRSRTFRLLFLSYLSAFRRAHPDTADQ